VFCRSLSLQGLESTRCTSAFAREQDKVLPTSVPPGIVKDIYLEDVTENICVCALSAVCTLQDLVVGHSILMFSLMYSMPNAEVPLTAGRTLSQTGALTMTPMTLYQLESVLQRAL